MYIFKEVPAQKHFVLQWQHALSDGNSTVHPKFVELYMISIYQFYQFIIHPEALGVKN